MKAVAKAATPTGAATTTGVIEELWKRAAPSLDRESLAWFSGATAQAESVAAHLQDVVEGVACLVSCDNHGTVDLVASGSFQSHDSLLALLYTIDNVRGLSHVGAEASHRLRRPELYR